MPLTPNRGGNANGNFTQFADGMMICTHRLATSAAGTATWVFLAAFVVADTRVSVTRRPRCRGLPGSAR